MGFPAEIIEYPSSKFKTTIFFWLISHHKILVGIILMKLNELYFSSIFFPYNRISQTPSRIRFTNTRSALHDNIRDSPKFCVNLLGGVE